MRTLIVDCVPNGNLNGSNSRPNGRIERPISDQGVWKEALDGRDYFFVSFLFLFLFSCVSLLPFALFVVDVVVSMDKRAEIIQLPIKKTLVISVQKERKKRVKK